MTDKLYYYIMDNFDITADHLRTLEEVYEYLKEDCHSLETSETPGYLVPCYWYHFRNICEAGSVDLTERELIDNTDEAKKRLEYYKVG